MTVGNNKNTENLYRWNTFIMSSTRFLLTTSCWLFILLLELKTSVLSLLLSSTLSLIEVVLDKVRSSSTASVTDDDDNDDDDNDGRGINCGDDIASLLALRKPWIINRFVIVRKDSATPCSTSTFAKMSWYTNLA